MRKVRFLTFYSITTLKKIRGQLLLLWGSESPEEDIILTCHHFTHLQFCSIKKMGGDCVMKEKRNKQTSIPREHLMSMINM